jgi:hypothetical protein
MWRFSTLEVDDMVKKRLGAIVLAALGIPTAIAVVILATNGDDDATTPTDELTSVTRPAKDVAQRFVEAVAAFDADAALSHVEAGADLTGVITSIGAQDVAGSTPEFRQFVSLLEALQYEQILDSCDRRWLDGPMRVRLPPVRISRARTRSIRGKHLHAHGRGRVDRQSVD